MIPLSQSFGYQHPIVSIILIRTTIYHKNKKNVTMHWELGWKQDHINYTFYAITYFKMMPIKENTYYSIFKRFRTLKRNNTWSIHFRLKLMKNDKSTNEPDLASFVKEKTSEHYINEYLYRMEEVNVHLYGVRNPISSW